MRAFRWLMILLLGLLGLHPAQAFDPEADVTLAFRKGAVVLQVPPGAHLKKAFMEVHLKPGSPGRIQVGKLPATDGKDELGDPVWHGTVAIPIKGEGLRGTVDLELTYQPCTEGEGGACYPPTDRTLKVPASAIPALGPTPTSPAPEPPTRVTPAPFAPPAASPAPPPQTSAAPAVPQAPSAPEPHAPGRSLPWALLVAFGFGLIASLTPCVYPMIPITMAIVGAKGGGKARGLALSLVLVLGMAVTYTILGVLAARTGAVFGAAAQQPGFLIPVSVIFGIFAFSLLGAFEIRLPDSLQSRLQTGPRKGWLGAFLMGLVLGPISAPCVGPFAGSVLLAIAQQGQVFLGGLQLFVFALGMGMLFVVVGTFSATLPRSGDWMLRLKALMGLVILAFAVWNLRNILPLWASQGLWALVLLYGASLLGAFQAAGGSGAGFLKALGLLALLLGLLLGLRSLESGLGLQLLPRGEGHTQASAAPDLWMAQDLEAALARARQENRMVLVDVYADWCAQCKELDEKTWPDPEVKEWIQAHAVPVRIDTDKVRKDLAGSLAIRSYPTVILLDGQGRELRRLQGYQGPRSMMGFLNVGK
nr:cytochrome c biogenesis protein CcdA [uncultured Holophaga sp.]